MKDFSMVYDSFNSMFPTYYIQASYKQNYQSINDHQYVSITMSNSCHKESKIPYYFKVAFLFSIASCKKSFLNETQNSFDLRTKLIYQIIFILSK